MCAHNVLSIGPATADLPPHCGERNAAAVLTEAHVRWIRQGVEQFGVTQTGIAELLGISDRAVRHIVSRTTWRHVQ